MKQHIVSLREGNTPLYQLARTAESTGVGAAVCQAPGDESTGSFKDAGMTAALSVAYERGFHVGGLRLDGEYFGGDGGVCGAGGDAESGADS